MREFLMIVQESAYKTPVASPVIWTTTTTAGTATGYYIRLDEGNAFTMRARPQTVEIPYGGGVAIGAYRASDKIECRGNLRCKATVALMPFLMNWSSERINTTQTLPWTTTEPVGDLASCAIYHAIARDDGTFRRRLYLGCKVDSWSIDMSTDSTVGTVNLGISGSTAQGNVFDGSSDPTPTVFPAPQDNNLPMDPYLFNHTQGHVLLNNVSRINISQCTMTGTNTIARSFFNQRFLGKLRFVGRTTNIGVRMEYVVTPDDRVTYEGQMPYGVTPVPVSIGFNNGVNSMTLGFNANNIIDPLDEDTPISDLYWQTSTWNNLYDANAHGDFAFTFT